VGIVTPSHSRVLAAVTVSVMAVIVLSGRRPMVAAGTTIY
jgi:hypothetical protein